MKLSQLFKKVKGHVEISRECVRSAEHEFDLMSSEKTYYSQIRNDAIPHDEDYVAWCDEQIVAFDGLATKAKADIEFFGLVLSENKRKLRKLRKRLFFATRPKLC